MCCRRFRVDIDEEDTEKICGLGYDMDDFSEMKDDKRVLRKCAKRRCFFLENDNSCRIHNEHGFDNKPGICRGFPTDEGKMQLFCGEFIDLDGELPPPKIKPDEIFLIGSKKVKRDVLLHMISYLSSDDYILRMNMFISGIGKWAKKTVGKERIDALNEQAGTEPNSFRMKSMLAYYADDYPSAYSSIESGNMIKINFPAFEFDYYPGLREKIELSDSDVERFLNLLKNGYGIVYEHDFPIHLLFSLYYLEDFARSIAFSEGRDKAVFLDIVNAYTILNSTTKFPRMKDL